MPILPHAPSQKPLVASRLASRKCSFTFATSIYGASVRADFTGSTSANVLPPA